jgi:APA family basic amino acid/polyamine antiporter
MADEVVFVRRASGLIREIGPFTVMTCGVNFTIADGIYNLTEWQSYQTPGANYPLALILGGLMLVIAGAVILLLAAATPRASSDYVAISRTLHPILGYIEAFMNIGVNAWVFGALAYFQAWYWGSFLIQAGVPTNNAYLIGLGSWMSSETTLGIGLGFLIVIIFSLINLVGMKTWKWTINVLFVIALAAGVITIGGAFYGVSIGQSGVATLWDQTYGQGAWQEIINVAQSSGWADYIAKSTGDAAVWGWPGPTAASATLVAMVPAAYAFWGMDAANYVAGEVSAPKRSFILGVLAAMVVTFVYYMLIALPTLSMYGQFTSFYNYVMFGGHGTDLLKINPIQTPTIAVMVASMFGKIAPWAAIIVTLGVAIWVLNGLPVYSIIPTRIMFAMSFDRFMPQKFAEVNPRFRTPQWSILLTAIIALIFVVVTALNPWFYAISVIAAVFVRWLFASWTAMILPYQRPDLYEQGYTGKISKIPVITIIGAVSTVTMSVLFIIGISQIAADYISLTWFLLWFIVGALLFAYFLARNSARGVKIETLFREIPPA